MSLFDDAVSFIGNGISDAARGVSDYVSTVTAGMTQPAGGQTNPYDPANTDQPDPRSVPGNKDYDPRYNPNSSLYDPTVAKPSDTLKALQPGGALNQPPTQPSTSASYLDPKTGKLVLGSPGSAGSQITASDGVTVYNVGNEWVNPNGDTSISSKWSDIQKGIDPGFMAWKQQNPNGGPNDYMKAMGLVHPVTIDPYTTAQNKANAAANASKETPEQIKASVDAFNLGVDQWNQQAIQDTKTFYAARGLAGSGAEQEALSKLSGQTAFYKATGKDDINQKALAFNAGITEFSIRTMQGYAQLAQQASEFQQSQAQQFKEAQMAQATQMWHDQYLGNLEMQMASDQRTADMWSSVGGFFGNAAVLELLLHSAPVAAAAV